MWILLVIYVIIPLTTYEILLSLTTYEQVAAVTTTVFFFKNIYSTIVLQYC